MNFAPESGTAAAKVLQTQTHRAGNRSTLEGYMDEFVMPPAPAGK
jgi:hypothetical protein